MILTIEKFKNKIECLKILRREYNLSLEQVKCLKLPIVFTSFYDKDELESMYKDAAEIKCEYTDYELECIKENERRKAFRLKYEEAVVWAESLPEKEQEYVKVLTQARIPTA